MDYRMSLKCQYHMVKDPAHVCIEWGEKNKYAMCLCKTQVEQVHTVVLSLAHQESEFSLKGVWRETAVTSELCLCKEE